VGGLTNGNETMSNTAAMQGMLYRTLGSTGEKVSAVGIGGWHIGLNGVDEQLSIRIIRTAVNRGINFMDNCWDYNEGASEIRMGKALLALLLTQSLHGAAVAVIMTPVALDTAGLLGVEPKAFAVAVIVGGCGHIPSAGRPFGAPDGTESRFV